MSEKFQFLMPDVLFYELISSDEPGRSRCFKKLPQKVNPIPLVEHVGALLRKEQAIHKSAGLPSEYLVEVNYRFNPQLRDGTYNLPDDSEAAIREIEDELKNDISNLVDQCNFIPELFPDICKGTTEKRKKYKSDCERYIAANVDELSNSLSRFELPGGVTMPSQEMLDESWALLRWFQVLLLFSVDIFWRRGSINYFELTDHEKEKLEHDVLDKQYLILGILQRGFATKDNKLIKFYNLLCPEGMLVRE